MLKSHRFFKLFLHSSFFFLFLLSLSEAVHAAHGTRAMVVTADPRATKAALDVLEKGGNAVDAAIAAQWVLNVVEPQSSGIGGGGFFLYYNNQQKRIYALDGRETAPKSATPNLFLDEFGDPYPFYPDRITGGLPVGVPGILKLLHEAHARFSTKKISFSDLFVPAIEYAERGMTISDRLAYFIDEEKDRLRMFPDSRKIFLDASGNPKTAGTLLKQPDLAKTFKLIQRSGLPAFYEGEIADDIVDAVRRAPYHPGFMTKEDLIYYQVIEREPVKGNYRGYDIFSMGPPSSGGSTLIEALNILEQYSLNLHGRSPDGIHLLVEAQKLAFQDRNQFLGDADFIKVPLEKLVSKDYAKERSRQFRFDQATSTPATSVRPLQLEGMHTSHISVVDEKGNMVSFTTTIESVFGSGMVVPGRGFILNNELTDFNEIPEVELGKLSANAVQGGKRPRSSMTPTMVFKNGFPVLVLGSPGGSTIIGCVLNVITNVLDLEMSLDDALQMPRVINRDGPIEMETQLYQNSFLKRELERRGHSVNLRAVIGNVQAIYFDPKTQDIVGESDPRGEGQALGY